MARRLPVQKETASFFAQMYMMGNPPWDIGRAQPAFVELANAGEVKGRVLDLGCGTGDLVMEMTERGLDATGVDFVPEAIKQAKAKARLRGLETESRFLTGDALEVELLGERFDTVLDSGLFHCLSDPERILYAQQVAKVLDPGGHLHVMVMSDWEDPAWGGPRRVSQQEILDTFQDGWKLADIKEARFLTRPGINIRGHAWLATFERLKVKASKPRKSKQAEPPVARSKPKSAGSTKGKVPAGKAQEPPVQVPATGRSAATGPAAASAIPDGTGPV